MTFALSEYPPHLSRCYNLPDLLRSTNCENVSKISSFGGRMRRDLVDIRIRGIYRFDRFVVLSGFEGVDVSTDHRTVSEVP